MKQLEEKTSGLHALIWHAITTKGFDIPNPKQLSDEIWDDIEHSFKTVLEGQWQKDKELAHKIGDDCYNRVLINHKEIDDLFEKIKPNLSQLKGEK